MRSRVLGLPVHRHLFSDERLERDPMATTVDCDIHAVVSHALRTQAPIDAREAQHIARSLFEHAGANAAQHVLGRALLENDGLDAGFMQQLPQQQPRRTRTDDGDLNSHVFPHLKKRVHGCTPPPQAASEQQKSRLLLARARVVAGCPIPSFK
jgi:hypothetical protein